MIVEIRSSQVGQRDLNSSPTAMNMNAMKQFQMKV